MTTKLPPIHKKWLSNIEDARFRTKVAKMLDSELPSPVFSKAKKSVESLASMMVMHGMQDAVPKDVLKKVVKGDDVKHAMNSNLLAKLADEGEPNDMTTKILAVLAMSRGIKSIRYLYWGGTDEIDLHDQMIFDCADEATEKKAHSIWEKLCASVNADVDCMFWTRNTDTGAGCGTVYSCDLTINFIDLTAHVGEEEYEEDDDGDDGWGEDE